MKCHHAIIVLMCIITTILAKNTNTCSTEEQLMVKTMIQYEVNPILIKNLFNCSIHKTTHLEIVKFMLDNGAYIETKDKNHDTRLCQAAQNGEIDIVKLLINYDANLDATCSYEKTALHYATNSNETEIVQFLLDNGANIEAQNDLSDTSLCIAAKDGGLEMVDLLLEYGANPNKKCFSNKTALHYAAEASLNAIDIAKSLILHKANIFAKTYDSKSPLDVAYNFGDTEMMEILRQEMLSRKYEEIDILQKLYKNPFY